LKLGLEFPRCSTKTTRKLGTNSVVLKTASMIEEYIDNVFYIALVPDSPTKLEAFFQNELLAGPATDVDGWDTEDWGYLAWEQVEEFCRVQDLKSTLRVFEFNRGQIY